MSDVKWVTVHRKEMDVSVGDGLDDHTEAMQVPGGVVLRNTVTNADVGNEGRSTLVFIPGVRVVEGELVG